MTRLITRHPLAFMTLGAIVGTLALAALASAVKLAFPWMDDGRATALTMCALMPCAVVACFVAAAWPRGR